MTDTELTDEQAEILRRTAKLMGNLFIARRDVKPVEFNGGWFPVREQCPKHEPYKRCALCNEAPTIPFKLGDFKDHLFGTTCYGTYLLDLDNKVKFIAFDVDLKKEGAQWWPILDAVYDETISDEELGRMVTNGELSLETQTGNLEAALHDPEHTGYRWARLLLRDRLETIAQSVTKELGLSPLIVITGGGGHVLVPFGELVPAVDARLMARNVAEASFLKPTKGDMTFWGTPENPSYEVELFPKQDTLATGSPSYGNLIRLPLGWHARAKVRTFFLDRRLVDGEQVWEYRKVGGLKTLEAAAAALGVGD